MQLPRLTIKGRKAQGHHHGAHLTVGAMGLLWAQSLDPMRVAVNLGRQEYISLKELLPIVLACAIWGGKCCVIMRQ